VKSMVVTAYGAPLEPRALDEPALTPGHALLRVLTCGVCFSDVKIARGKMPFSDGLALPHIPGHEICAEVLETDPAGAIAPGTRVVVYNVWPCGHCDRCRAGEEQICRKPEARAGFTDPGGFRERMVAPLDRLLPVPDVIDSAHAAPLTCALGTAYRAVITRGQVVAGVRVAVIGIGCVGGWCVEALARAGVGRMLLVDGDTLALTNINRHVLGTPAAVGRPKVELARERVLAINPRAVVECRCEFVRPDTPLLGALLPAGVHVVVDACDSLPVKAHIAEECSMATPPVPLICALGAARRLDPTRVRVTTLGKTFGDPLAARLRKALRKTCGQDALSRISVMFSDEPPCGMPEKRCIDPSGAKVLPSFVTVPAAAGLAAAHFVVSRIIAASGDPPVVPR